MFQVLYPAHWNPQKIHVTDGSFTVMSRRGTKTVSFADISRITKQCRIGYDRDQHCDLTITLVSGERIKLLQEAHGSDALIECAKNSNPSIDITILSSLLAGETPFLPDILVPGWISLVILVLLATIVIYLAFVIP